MKVNLNDNMSFERIEEQIRYVSDYADDYGNNWTIDLLGIADTVLAVANKPRIIVNAVSEHDNEFYELRRVLSQEKEVPSDLDYEKAPRDVDSAYDLQVRISLNHIESPGQHYVIHIHIDPLINGRKHLWTFDFGQKVVDFYVGVKNISGQVGSHSWLLDNGYVGQAEIWRSQNGNPTEYEIESHVGIYREL